MSSGDGDGGLGHVRGVLHSSKTHEMRVILKPLLPVLTSPHGSIPSVGLERAVSLDSVPSTLVVRVAVFRKNGEMGKESLRKVTIFGLQESPPITSLRAQWYYSALKGLYSHLTRRKVSKDKGRARKQSRELEKLHFNRSKIRTIL